jgi:exosortase A
MAEVVRGAQRRVRERNYGAREAIFACGTAAFWLIAFAALFPFAAGGAFRVWVVSPTFNHCFLIVPISFFLIWNRRAALANFAPAPDLRAAVAILAVVPVWLVISLAGVVEAQQLVILTMVQVALFGTLGAVWYRRLAAPFLYLYFLVPSGAYLVPVLQSFTARFAVVGLHLLSIPVFSNGAVIEVPAGSFAVAEACAGLRFLVAAVAFGVFFAVVTYRSWFRRTAFVALSVVVPVIANGFRALGLIAAAEWIGNPAAAMADHIIYGWIFFSFVLVLLIVAGQFFSDRSDGDGAPRGVRETPAARLRFIPIAGAAGACLLAAAAAPVAASLLPHARAVALPTAAPVVAAPWREVPASPDWKPVVASPARVFSQTFVDGPRHVDRFIALYRNEGQGGNVARSNDRAADERAWSFDSEKNGVLTSREGAIPVQVSMWLGGSGKRVVWSFYMVNGHVTVGFWRAKWDALRAYLTGAKCLSAYVALSEETADQPPSGTDVSRLLQATQNLGSWLCGTSPTARRKDGREANSIRPRSQG